MTLLTSQSVVAWHDRTATEHKALLDEWPAVQTGHLFFPPELVRHIRRKSSGCMDRRKTTVLTTNRSLEAAVFVGCSLIATAVSADAPCIQAGSAYGTYCSGTWPSGGWAFNSATAGGDVCAQITQTGGTVQRRGLYRNSAMNRVVVRCGPPSYGWVGIYEGMGNGPLTAAYDSANGEKKKGCIFTVSPNEMPIFDAPFPLGTSYAHATGVDYAKSPYNTLDVADFGQSGSSAATVVDWKGRDRSSGGYLDGHAGHDWTMARGTSIRAVAAGTVVMAREYDSGVTTSDSPLQKEVAIVHTVCASPGFYERFLTYYAHLQSYSVQVNQVVNKGDQIARSGHTGSSSQPHLHFGVIRLTNTADKLEETVHWLPPPQHSDATDKAIEPYGWAAPKGFDPWAWKAYPQGALSPYLWRNGQAPATGQW